MSNKRNGQQAPQDLDSVLNSYNKREVSVGDDFVAKQIAELKKARARYDEDSSDSEGEDSPQINFEDNTRLRGKIEELHRQIDDLEDEKKAFGARMMKAEKNEKALMSKLEARIQAETQMKKEITKLQMDIQKLQSEEAEGPGVDHMTLKKNERLEAALAEERGNMASMKSEFAALRAKNDVLRKRYEKKSAAGKGVLDEQEAKYMAIINLQQEKQIEKDNSIKKLHGDVARLSSDITKQNKELVTLRESQRDLKGQIAIYKQQLEAKNAELEKKNEELKLCKSDRDKARKELKALHITYKDIADRLAVAETDNRRLQKQVKDEQEKNEQLRQAMIALEDRMHREYAEKVYDFYKTLKYGNKKSLGDQATPGAYAHNGSAAVPGASPYRGKPEGDEHERPDRSARQLTMSSGVARSHTVSRESPRSTSNDEHDVLRAAAKGDISRLMKLLKGDPKERRRLANLSDKAGCTALMWAARAGVKDAVQKLLADGADVSAHDREGWTALHEAADNGHDEIVQLLVDSDAKLDQQTKPKGCTALHIAAAKGHDKVAGVLLKEGADVGVRDKALWTALHFAANRGHAKVVDALLKQNVDASARNAGGYTALDCAQSQGHVDVVRLLQNPPANKDDPNEIGRRESGFWNEAKGHVQTASKKKSKSRR